MLNELDSFNPDNAEEEIIALGKEELELKEQLQGHRKTPSDVVASVEIHDRIDAIKKKRIELGRKLLAYQDKKEREEIQKGKPYRDEAHKKLSELHIKMNKFFNEADKAFTKIGEDFIELRAFSEELKKLNKRVEAKSRDPAISNGHLVSPGHLNNILKTLMSDAFAIKEIKAHSIYETFSLGNELKRIEDVVEPREGRKKY